MIVESQTVTSWADLTAAAARFTDLADGQWLFRGGDADDSKLFSTTLERAASRLGIDRSELPAYEVGLIRRFKRTLYHYTPDVPADGEYTEWLAVMQHFGAPTRLLDWTRTFFAACFFAIERKDGDAAVWAVNENALSDKFRKTVPSAIQDLVKPGENVRTLDAFVGAFNRVPPLRFVVPLNPYRLNPRLSIQQGVFLCPGDVTSSFRDNLKATLGSNPTPDELYKLVLPKNPSFRRKLVRHLHRMNMNAASLYPGLDGFAWSLWDVMALDAKFLPPDPDWIKAMKAAGFAS